MRKNKLTNAGLTPVQSMSIEGVVVTGLSAAGTTQATAAICPGDTNVFATVVSGAGCQVGTLSVGDTLTILCPCDEYIIANHGANALLVYPPVGGAINNGTVNAAISIAANTSVLFKAITTLNLITL